MFQHLKIKRFLCLETMMSYIVILLGVVLLLGISCADVCISSDESWKSIVIRTIEQVTKGLAGGEGFQMVHAIAYAPNDPEIVYMSTDTSQIWKSSDGGFSWRPARYGFGANGARSLIVDPVNSNIVFAAGFLGESYKNVKDHNKPLQGIFLTE